MRRDGRTNCYPVIFIFMHVYHLCSSDDRSRTIDGLFCSYVSTALHNECNAPDGPRIREYDIMWYIYLWNEWKEIASDI